MRRLAIIVIAATTAAGGGFARAELDIPASGTFDIVIDPPGTPGISFDPIPYTGSGVYLLPFASEDGSYISPYSDYNLAYVAFIDGSIYLSDQYEQEGDLGIRVNNISNATQTFDSSVLTLDFVGDSLDVYLPGFTFDHGSSMFFWVAESGATYYAHYSKDFSDAPNMLAADAMAAGDEYLARTPEPATVVLLGLGVLLLRRRGKAGSN
jgi:hypothetical protein